MKVAIFDVDDTGISVFNLFGSSYRWVGCHNAMMTHFPYLDLSSVIFPSDNILVHTTQAELIPELKDRGYIIIAAMKYSSVTNIPSDYNLVCSGDDISTKIKIDKILADIRKK